MVHPFWGWFRGRLCPKELLLPLRRCCVGDWAFVLDTVYTRDDRRQDYESMSLCLKSFSLVAKSAPASKRHPRLVSPEAQAFRAVLLFRRMTRLCHCLTRRRERTHHPRNASCHLRVTVRRRSASLFASSRSDRSSNPSVINVKTTSSSRVDVPQ